MDADNSQSSSVFPVTGPLVTVVEETQFRCPGDTHSISRSVHLSRLAAFYPACRQCQHRGDTGQLPPRTVERIQQAAVFVLRNQAVLSGRKQLVAVSV